MRGRSGPHRAPGTAPGADPASAGNSGVNPEIEALLSAAAEVSSEMRAELLARECPDPSVRAEVAALMQYADEAESYFDNIIQGAASSLLTGLEPSPGDVIGSYRIIRAIGMGGMGSVYLA